MTESVRLRREIEALRERISGLNSAILRINTSLDENVILHEVVESTRALTRARYGVITSVDASGNLQNLATSGLTPVQQQKMFESPDGWRLFEHLRDAGAPLRIRNLTAYVRSLGYEATVADATTFQGTPMHHRGAYVGSFFLAEKDDGAEFTHEDEEILLMFASQAAAAISNARTYRAEQRTRADLEALVETSPVGVVVFDARTGNPVSLNREAKRIVGCLVSPGGSAYELLNVMTCRHADGREFALDELPLSRVLMSAAPTRSEEVVLSVPDGRSVTTLINVTPIHSEEGEVASVVVTMQDLAPLEEMERLRTEFLGMVSHELRAPLTSIKGSTSTVLGTAPAMDPAEMLQFFRIVDEQADHMRGLISDLLDAEHIHSGTLSVAPEPTEVVDLVDHARSTFLSGGGRQNVQLDLPTDLPKVLADERRIVQVLNNLLSNASRHSPRQLPIRIAAAREDVHVAVSVSDQGDGVTQDVLPHLFRKHAVGRSADRTRGFARSGLGLAICKGLVEAHGGRIWAYSGGAGQGTRITFTIPVAESAGNGAGTGDPPDRSHAPSERRNAARILVVDDDPQVLRYVRDVLATAGFAPIVTGDQRELSRLVRTKNPELVLLDLMLPGADGIELMETVPELADVPVIFVSGYGRDETIARALEHGAADYIVKPFSPTELTARVRANLRRQAAPEPFRRKDLVIDYEQRRVTLEDRPVQLTATEFELLRVLAANAGRITTYESLLRRVWRGRDTGDPEVIRAFVKNVRRKLGDDAANPAYIFTERGVGYRMAKSDDP